MEPMSTSEPSPNSNIRAMHRCKFCGHLSSREDISEVAIYSGVVECPKCGEASALDVVIEDTKETPGRKP